MKLRSRAGGLLLGVSLVVAAGVLPSSAQDPDKVGDASATAPARPAKAAAKGYRRVPPYFGKIGLTSEQKERIYEIRGKHQEEIEAMKAKIEEAEAREMAECESVLLDSQKKVLSDLRASSKTAKTAKKSN